MAKFLVDTRPLRSSKDFSLLMFGQLVSLLGSNLTLVAVPYEIYRQTHSSLWVGLVSLFQLPFLISGSLWGGVLGDRFNRRTLLVIFSAVQSVAVLGLALNASLHTRHLYLLFFFAGLAAGLGGVFSPIRSASIPKLLAPEELTAAYALNQIVMNGGTVIGPALAGVLLASLGLSSCFIIDAVTFLLLSLCARLMSDMPVTVKHDGTRLLHSIAQGFRYIKENKVTQAVYLVDLSANIFGLPRALFPAVALTIYHAGPRTLGLLYAAPGFGALIMAFSSGWVGSIRKQGRFVTMAVISWGASMALFGLIHLLFIGLICLAVAGAMDVISTIFRSTILQNAITDEFRSRVSSVQIAVVQGGPRLGDVESGLVAGISSTEFSIVSGGIACIAGVLLLCKWRPQLWNATTSDV
jgi:MFS family permease